MILSAPGPLDPTARGLRTLFVSLNSPVVTLATLPVGPASAAVAVHESPAAGATLAIRSARTGTLAFYTASGDAAATEAAPDPAGEAALAFAESLGFLFEEVAEAHAPEGGPARLALRWREWIGDDAEEVEAAPSGAATAVEPALLLSKFRGPFSDPGIHGAAEAAMRRAERAEEGFDVCLELTSRF